MSVFALEETPSKLSSHVVNFCRSVNPLASPIFVKVVPDTDAKMKDCFYAVRQKCEQQGGEIAFGWNIWTLPHVWLKAEHHAIWQLPSGEHVDITPKANDVSRIVFLPDQNRSYDFHQNRRIMNVLHPLASDDQIRSLYEAEKRVFEFEEKNSPDGGMEVLGDKSVYARLMIDKEIALAKLCLKRLRASEPCRCRSGKKFRECHAPEFAAILQMGGEP